MKVITTKAIGDIPAGSQGIRQQVNGSVWRVQITHKRINGQCIPFTFSLGYLSKDYFELGQNCP